MPQPPGISPRIPAPAPTMTQLTPGAVLPLIFGESKYRICRPCTYHLKVGADLRKLAIEKTLSTKIFCQFLNIFLKIATDLMKYLIFHQRLN